MNVLNVEIKARCPHPEKVRSLLASLDARYIGRDHQVDTYYTVPRGRLKLRQGNIENSLIAYARQDRSGPKASRVVLYKSDDMPALKAALDAALDVQVVVDKKRDIYFVNHVKFHVDDVRSLGTFMEIEAIDTTGGKTEEQLHSDCMHYLEKFNIAERDLMTHSYSDMLLALNVNNS